MHKLSLSIAYFRFHGFGFGFGKVRKIAFMKLLETITEMHPNGPNPSTISSPLSLVFEANVLLLLGKSVGLGM
jgi:hypothetical protein